MMNYLDEAVKAISESIRFDSSCGAPLPGMPFGKGAADCLIHFLTLAKALGFETHNYDNYIGEAVWRGTDPSEEFAVLAHLDVVPAGNGWSVPPFGGTVKEGRIWGRGAMDDKGPAIATLFALKKLKDEGFCPKKTVKLLAGCDEELDWRCIHHYKQVAVMPKTGFSPDADFPVIYAEKGIYHFRADFPLENAPFSLLEGGGAVNMVCDRAEAIPLSPVDSERATALGLHTENGRLVSIGQSAHGSTPEKGVNAILPLLKYFDLQRVIDCLFDDVYGLKTLQDETGSLTLSPDVIRYTNGVLSVECDVRYPATVNFDEVKKRVDAFGCKITALTKKAPLYQDKNSPLIKTLSAVYDEYTGTKHEPIAIGGGTYARALECGVAFGPEIEGEEITIHRQNEYITIDRVNMMIHVYSEAVRRLTA